MRRLAFEIEYDGAAYAGWQRQPGRPTIQAAIEETLASITQEPCRLTGAGRTDAGVHALGQVAHLDTASRLPVARLQAALGALLPHDIVVRHVLDVAPDFHARRDARLRVYRYAILTRSRPSVLLRRYACHVPGPLDLKAMRTGAGALVGRHDFAAYRVTGTATASTTCDVRAVRLDTRGPVLIVTVAADRFLRQMVRRIVGTLLAVGRGTRSPDDVGVILLSRDNARAAPAVPAHGLYLTHVFYPAGRLRAAAQVL
jgi:tRNA pseudouridine38-40 synthase